jgi:hypothetical protein
MVIDLDYEGIELKNCEAHSKSLEKELFQTNDGSPTERPALSN